MSTHKTFILIRDKVNPNYKNNDANNHPAVRLFPSIFASYGDRFTGVVNVKNRELSASELWELLRATRPEYHEILREATYHGISKERVFSQVVEWVTLGLYADRSLVQQRFFRYIDDLSRELNLKREPELDALGEDLSFEIQDEILCRLQDMTEATIYWFLEDNLCSELKKAHIKTIRKFEISLERKKELLETESFWEKVASKPQNRRLRYPTLMEWLDEAIRIRNAAVHRNTLSVVELISGVQTTIKLINCLEGRTKWKDQLGRCMDALNVWKTWSTTDKVESMLELVQISNILEEKYSNDKQRLETEIELWTLKMMIKRNSDREPLWDDLFRHTKEIFNGLLPPRVKFQVPKSRESLSIKALAKNCGLAEENESKSGDRGNMKKREVDDEARRNETANGNQRNERHDTDALDGSAGTAANNKQASEAFSTYTNLPAKPPSSESGSPIASLDEQETVWKKSSSKSSTALKRAAEDSDEGRAINPKRNRLDSDSWPDVLKSEGIKNDDREDPSADSHDKHQENGSRILRKSIDA